MPDANLKIIVSMVDKASAQMKGFKGKVDDLAKAVPGLTGALKLATNPVVLLTAGITAAGGIMRESVKDTLAYADQIRDLSRAIGTSAEESSTLIQVADDLFVSYDTMKLAMKAAMKDGITPNIDGLKDLAEQYQAIKDPAAKSAFAMEKFGKAGLEMAKILEVSPAQLDKMAKSLKGSALIMDQNAVNAAYKYKQQMDQLNDRIAALKTTIGTGLIPIIVNITTKVNEYADESIRTEQVQKDLDLAYQRGQITMWEGMKLIDKVRWTQEGLNEVEAEAKRLTEEYIKSIPGLTEALEASGSAAVLASGDAGMGVYNQSLKDIAGSADDAAGANDDLAASIAGVSKAAIGKEALDNLKKAYEQGRISADEFNARQAIITTQWLGMPALEVSAGTAIDQLGKDFLAGKIPVDEYLASLSGVYGNLTAMNGQRYTTTFEVIQVGTNYHANIPSNVPGAPKPKSIIPTGPPKNVRPNARGADYIVPMGYSNERWNVGSASSGERVTITTKGGASNAEVVSAIMSLKSFLPRAIRDAMLKAAV